MVPTLNCCPTSAFSALDHSSLQPGHFFSFFICPCVCSLLPESIWLQLFQLTYNIFELLIKITLDLILGLVACTSWWDTVPSKQQWQSLMSFNFGCYWVHFVPPKVCCIYNYTHFFLLLATVVANIVSENTGCTMQAKITIICYESSIQWMAEHCPNPSLSCN